MSIPWINNVNVSSIPEMLWRLVKENNASEQSQSPGIAHVLGSWFRSRRAGSHDTSVLKAPGVVTSLYPRLWALIIGINDYSPTTTKTRLRGAVPDANAMDEYLRVVLKVPKEQIDNLRDKDATRSGIIAAFERMRDNRNIKRQDPILIYYAGHGGEVPSDHNAKTQTLIPVDYVPEQIHPIPDRTVAALINGISKHHGNNITVIFDCCHSGSGTRGDGETDESIVRACELSPNDDPDDLDARILKENSGKHQEPTDKATTETGARGLRLAKGFATKGMQSHVHLAACSANEQAREDKETPQMFRGRFTTALLELLKNVQPDQITYADILFKIPRIDGQNPQCEGFHKDRILFDSKVRPHTRLSYELNYSAQADGTMRYVLEGGRAHGITDGAQFTLYQNSKAALAEEPLGVLIAKDDNIQPFTTFLEVDKVVPTAFSNPAIAIQTRAGAPQDLLVYAPLGSGNNYESLLQAIAKEMSTKGLDPCRINLVESAERDKATYEIVASEDKLAFSVLEKRATKYGFTRMPHVVDADAGDLHRVLRAASHYHFHLNNNHPNNQIKESIDIEFFALEDKGHDEVYSPVGENMHRGGRIECVVDVDGDTKYGMKITNKSPWSLYLYCFFFDHADLSIDVVTEVDTKTRHQKDYPLEKGATFEMGYGKSSVPPLECEFPEGLNVTIGFLKFYFTTEVVNLSHVPQGSPFGSAERKLVRSRLKIKPVWGTVVIPVVQKRRQSTVPSAVPDVAFSV